MFRLTDEEVWRHHGLYGVHHAQDGVEEVALVVPADFDQSPAGLEAVGLGLIKGHHVGLEEELFPAVAVPFSILFS